MNRTVRILLLFNFVILGNFSRVLSLDMFPAVPLTPSTSAASAGLAAPDLAAEFVSPAITSMALQVGSKVSTEVGAKVSKQVGTSLLANLGLASSKMSADASKNLAAELKKKLDVTANQTIKDITKKLGDEVFDKLSKELDQKLRSDVASSGFVDDVVDKLSKQLLAGPNVQPTTEQQLNSAPQTWSRFGIVKPVFILTALGTMGYATYCYKNCIEGMEAVQKDIKKLLGHVNLEYHMIPEGFSFSSYRTKVNINDDVVFPCAHAVYVKAGYITDNNVTVPEFFRKSGEILSRSKFVETIYKDIVLSKIAIFRGKQRAMLETENGRPKLSSLEEISKALKRESASIDTHINKIFEATGRTKRNNKKIFIVDQILFDVCNDFKNKYGIPFYKVDFMEPDEKMVDLNLDINLHEHLRIFNEGHIGEVRDLFLKAVKKELASEPSYNVTKLYEHVYVAPTFLFRKLYSKVWNKYCITYNNLFELYFELVVSKSRLNAMCRLLDLHIIHCNSSSGVESGGLLNSIHHLANSGGNKTAVSKIGLLNSFDNIITDLEDKAVAENNYRNFDITPVVGKLGKLDKYAKIYLDSKTNPTGVKMIAAPITAAQEHLSKTTKPDSEISLVNAVPYALKALRQVRKHIEDNF